MTLLSNSATNISGKYLLAGTEWASYTPTWGNTGTANSLGNGTITARYRYSGVHTVEVMISLVWGSTTTSGSGTWTFTLPVTSGGYHAVGAALAYDSSATSNYAANGKYVDTTHIAPVAGSANNGFTSTAPFTWATSDECAIFYVYESV